MYNFGEKFNSINSYDTFCNLLHIVMVIVGICLAFSFVIFAVLYIFKAIGVFNMSKSENIKNPWIAFIPVVNAFTFGKLAENYKKRDGTKSIKFSFILLGLSILNAILSILTIIFSVISYFSITSNLNNCADNNKNISIDMFSSLIPVIIFTVLLSLAYLTYRVFQYVALWRVFSSFSYNNATAFLILSILFNFLSPFFLFAIRNKKPTLEYADRMGLYTNNY